jgi:hypothetical protein
LANMTGFVLTNVIPRLLCILNHFKIKGWLPRKDSNLDKEIQNLSCYHYTTRHCRRDET